MQFTDAEQLLQEAAEFKRWYDAYPDTAKADWAYDQYLTVTDTYAEITGVPADEVRRNLGGTR